MNRHIVFISVVAALGGLLFGFDTAVISGVLPNITRLFGLSESGQGWAVSCIIVGCMAGTQIAGKLADIFGRKKSLAFTALIFIITTIGTALSQHYPQFILFRIFSGVAVGMASVISPMYISEIAPAAVRGKLVSLNQLTIVLGILLSFFINYLLADVSNNWRWMLASMLPPAVLFFIFSLFIDESPRWLLSGNRIKEAEIIAARLGLPDMLTVHQTKAERSFISQLKELLSRSRRKMFFAGIILALLQQFTGINVIMYFAPLIFERSGSGYSTALLQTTAIGLINVIFTVAGMFLMDRLGRRTLLKYGAISMCIFLSLLSFTYASGTPDTWVMLILILGFIASFAASFGPALWVVISEIYPTQLRGTAVGIAMFFLWIGALLVSYSFPVLLKQLPAHFIFLIYACINLFSFFYVHFNIPETRSKSLEELDVMLASH